MSVNVYDATTKQLSPLTSAFSQMSIYDVAQLPTSDILDVIYRVASDNWEFVSVELFNDDMAQNTINLEAIGFTTSYDGSRTYPYTPSEKVIRYLFNDDNYRVSRVIIDTTGRMQIYNTAEELLADGTISSGALYPFYTAGIWADVNITLSSSNMAANTAALEAAGFSSSTDNVNYTYLPSGKRFRYNNEDVAKIVINISGNMKITDPNDVTIYDDTIVDGVYTFQSASAVTYWIGNKAKQTAEQLAKIEDIKSFGSVSSLQDIFNTNENQTVSGANNKMVLKNGNTAATYKKEGFEAVAGDNSANLDANTINLSHKVSGVDTTDFRVTRSAVAMNNDVKASFKALLNINDTQGIVAPIELGTTSANAYAIGDLVINGDTLYKVTAVIAVNDPFTPGTNVTATTVEEVINNAIGGADDRVDLIDADFAPVENGTAAAHAYAVGDLLIREDVLYKVIAPISVADSFIVNTNIEAITVEDFVHEELDKRDDVIEQIEKDITSLENGTTSAKAYAIGDLLIRNDILYKVIDAIAIGDSFTVGTNISAVTIEELLNLRQNKTLDTALTIDGVSATTVEGALGALNTKKIDISKKGAANGVAELDAQGKVPAEQLPSYVDDVIEGYHNPANDKFYETYTVTYDAVTPVGTENPSEESWYEEVSAGVYELTTDTTVDPLKTYYEKVETYSDEITPEAGKIYIDKITNETFRWGSTQYVPIRSDLTLGETSTTAYRGDRGKIAYETSLENADRLDVIDSDIASVDESTATAAHEIGDLIVVEDNLYKVTAAISIGDTIAVGTNVADVTLEDLLKLKTDLTLIADAFDTTEAYKTKDVVIYNQKLYRFTNDKAAGAWDSTKVEAVTIQNLIANATPDSFTTAQKTALIDLLADD